MYFVRALVEGGLLRRHRYNEHPPRDEYVLTEKGRELRVALNGLRQWGDRYLCDEPPRLLKRRSDGKPVIVAFVPEDARNVLAEDEVESVPGPGA